MLCQIVRIAPHRGLHLAVLDVLRNISIGPEDDGEDLILKDWRLAMARSTNDHLHRKHNL